MRARLFQRSTVSNISYLGLECIARWDRSLRSVVKKPNINVPGFYI